VPRTEPSSARTSSSPAGGGRGGPWFSAPGNLYLSVLLRAALPVRRSAELAFVAGLAVADAVDAALPSGSRAWLKWPNDVQIDGAKVAGVLVERAEGDGGTVSCILGIGVNVGHAPSGLPYSATCLREHGGASVTATREHLLAAIAARWNQWLRDGFGVVRADWLGRGPQPGAPLRVSLPDGAVDGTFADLDTDGALLLHTASGTRHIVAGDVVAVSQSAVALIGFRGGKAGTVARG